MSQILPEAALASHRPPPVQVPLAIKPPRRILVTNSQAPKAIGDAIAAVPALVEAAKHDPLDVYWTAPALPRLFHIEGARQLFFTNSSLLSPPDTTLDIQSIYAGFCQFGIPMPEAYARALGVRISDPAVWPSRPVPGAQPMHISRPDGWDPKKPYVLVSPHSYSDFGSGYKIWPIGRWLAVVERLIEAGFQVGLLEAAGDKPALLSSFTLSGRSLPEVAAWMLGAACVTTIDNGMSWLAQAVGAVHVQVLSVDSPQAWTWDFGPRAQNISDVRSATAEAVIAATLKLIEATTDAI